MRTVQQQARLAGRLYLLSAVIAPIGLMIVPGRLIVAGDAVATAERIRAADWLLRLGIASELAGQVLGVFIVLALYRLFKPVDEGLARQLVVLGALVSVPITMLNVVSEIATLILVRGPEWLTVFSGAERDALAYLFLRLHGQGLAVASIFWGLWLFPFGLLVIRSGFIPRLLGLLLMLAGSAYVASSFVTLSLPEWSKVVNQIALPLYFGELPIIFWLAIRGARMPRGTAPVA